MWNIAWTRGQYVEYSMDWRSVGVIILNFGKFQDFLGGND